MMHYECQNHLYVRTEVVGIFPSDKIVHPLVDRIVIMFGGDLCP